MSSPRAGVSRTRALGISILAALLTTTYGCVTTLGYIPANLKPTRWTWSGPERTLAPPTLRPTYAQVKEWAYDVQDGYDSRATLNRQAIYFGALFAAASAAAVVGLAAFSAGTAALIALPIGATFLAGTAAIYNNDVKADLYGRASTYVKRLIDVSDKRVVGKSGDSSVLEHEASCLKTEIDILMAKVDRHITMLDPQNVVTALNAVGQQRPAPATPGDSSTAAATPDPPGTQEGAQDQGNVQTQVNEILRYARRDMSDLDVPADLQTRFAVACDGGKVERGREIHGIRWFGAINVAVKEAGPAFLIDSPGGIRNEKDRQNFHFFGDDMARVPLDTKTVQELRNPSTLTFDPQGVLFSVALRALTDKAVRSVSYGPPQRVQGVQWIGPFRVRFDEATRRYVLTGDGGFSASDRTYLQFFTDGGADVVRLEKNLAQKLRDKAFAFNANDATFSVSREALDVADVKVVSYQKSPQQ